MEKERAEIHKSESGIFIDCEVFSENTHKKMVSSVLLSSCAGTGYL